MDRRLVSAVAAFVVWLGAADAFAQMSDGEKKAAARAAFTDGVDLQEKGRPPEALLRFEAAQKLFDAPTHLLHIAECQVLTGKLVEASETYETLTRKVLPAGSPEAFVQAQEQGKAELAALKPRIPTLKVTIKPDPRTLQGLQITVNDHAIPAELVGIARPVNPGAYRLSATATGYATPTATSLEIPEKEPRTVELTLVAGAAGPVAPPPPPGATPPPYEQTNAPKPKPGPTPTGLLLGVRGGIFVPSGDLDKDRTFKQFASAGPGFAVDGLVRLVRLVLVGGTLEYASLGAPDASSLPAGRSEVTTRMLYLGLVLGIVPNIDKFSFIGDVGLGYRGLSRDVKLGSLANATRVAFNETYGGSELGVNVGVSIPIGPVRLVPKAGLAFGSFGSRSCEQTAGVATLPQCSNTSSTFDSASHTVVNVGLGLYYSLDFGKKSGAASLRPSPGRVL